MGCMKSKRYIWTVVSWNENNTANWSNRKICHTMPNASQNILQQIWKRVLFVWLENVVNKIWDVKMPKLATQMEDDCFVLNRRSLRTHKNEPVLFCILHCCKVSFIIDISYYSCIFQNSSIYQSVRQNRWDWKKSEQIHTQIPFQICFNCFPHNFSSDHNRKQKIDWMKNNNE